MPSGLQWKEKLKERNKDLAEEKKMEFRIGVNLGDVVEEGDTIYGDGVNIAARLESLAEAGGVCISGMVYENIRIFQNTVFFFKKYWFYSIYFPNAPAKVFYKTC